MVGCFGANSVPSFLPPNPLVSHAKLIPPIYHHRHQHQPTCQRCNLSRLSRRPVQCRNTLPGGCEIISENAAYYFCIYCKFRTFFLPPDPLVSHAKIILPIIIVNINIRRCICVLAIFSSVSQNKITPSSI